MVLVVVEGVGVGRHRDRGAEGEGVGRHRVVGVGAGHQLGHLHHHLLVWFSAVEVERVSLVRGGEKRKIGVEKI